MDKVSKTWLTVLGGATALILAFGLLALVLYQRTERGVVERHSQDQKMLAELAALAMAHQVDAHLHTLEPGVKQLLSVPERRWEETLATLPVAPAAGQLLLLYRDGTLSFREPREDEPAVRAAVSPWREARTPALTNPLTPRGPNREFVLLVPLQRRGRLLGHLGLIIPLSSLVSQLSSLGTKSAHLKLGLLDEKGTVLANARHPEMVGRRIPPLGQGCLPCHGDFSIERKMLAGGAGVELVQVAQEPKLLVAHTLVHLLGRRWLLTLTEPYSAIVADTHRGFRAIVFLLGLSLLVGVAAIGVTVQYRGQRRRAEERAKLAELRTVMERRLRQTEGLAAIGKMTSQIAHQINTPLAALGLNVSYLQTEVERRLGQRNSGVEEVSKAIAEEIDRLKRVVNDYLRFSRLPEPVLVEDSLRNAVDSLLDFVEPEAAARGVRLEANLGTEPALVRLDAELFRQAFLNLVRNGLEAMPHGGTLRVELNREGDHLALRIQDTGEGIQAADRGRIFDPFFTTKKDGTGLGLAHARRVIEQHGGTIECTSAPRQGTSFTVRLPAAGQPAEAMPELAYAGKDGK